MAVELTVAGEELRKAVEMVSLVGSVAGGKKKGEDEMPGQNVLRIVATSPNKDKKYLIALGVMNVVEQAEYFLEGKSYTSTDNVDVYVELKRFAALARTVSGDVNFKFSGNEVELCVGTSKYTLTTITASLPFLKMPDGGVELPARLLEDARTHCGIVVPKTDGNVAMTGIQIKIASDGTACCWGANRNGAAKLVMPNTGVKQEYYLLMTPVCMKHVSDFAEGENILIAKENNAIFASGQRFRYRCNTFVGKFPDVDKMEAGIKEAKRNRVAKSRLLTAIIRAGVMAGEDENSCVKLCSDAENLYVEGASVAGVGMEQVALEGSEGADNDAICFPADKLSRIISNCQGEEITICTNGWNRPVKIAVTGSNSFYVLAPMRPRG